MLLFRLTTKTYLSPQLLLYLPIDVPVHYPTCSFWLFHSDKPFVLTCPLTCCSKYSQIYPFINQLVPFVCVCHLTLHAHLSVNPDMNVPVNSGYDLFKNSPHSFRITYMIYPSTQLLLYIYPDLLGNNLPLCHDAFLPANHEDLSVDSTTRLHL